MPAQTRRSRPLSRPSFKALKQITITDGSTGKPIRETADGLKDPSGAAKDTAEREWTAALLQYWREQRERIKKKLAPGIPKSRKAIGDLPKRLDADFWRNEDEELLALFLPLLSEAAVDGAGTLEGEVEELGLMVDWTLPNAEAVEWARRYSGSLIKGINSTTKEGVRQALAAWLDTPGSTMGDLFGTLDGMFAFGQSRAQMIGVTEVTRAYFEGNQAAARATETEGLVTWKKIWRTNRDDLVCNLCEPLDEVSVIGVDTEFPDGAGQGPPRHPRCILPGNEVVIPGPILAAAKSFYVGRCVETRLANGRIFTVTQNHPILTPTGWVAAQLLREGNDVLCASGIEWVFAGIEPDYDYSPTPIEEVFDTFMETGLVTTVRVPTAAEYLHGDGRFVDGDIEIVYPNGLLLSDAITRLAELRSELGLSENDTSAIALPGEGGFTTFIPGDSPPPAGSVSGGNLRGTLSGRHSGPFSGFGGGLSTGDNASSKQPLAESPAIDTSLAREFIFRFAGQVAAEQIVEIRHFDFSGHVYDLQCDLFQLYTCNGVLSSNCRCWPAYEPVI